MSPTEDRENPSTIVERLFNQFSERLYSFAVNAWRFSEDDAWETIYATLFHIAKVYHRYDFSDERRLKNFVLTSFNNRLRNRYRENKHALVTIPMENFDGVAEEIMTTRGKSEESIVQALNELEDWERILVLQRASDTPYATISELTHKPESQLKVYHKRVLAKLEKRVKEILTESHNEPNN